jgi:hypothetical protein
VLDVDVAQPGQQALSRLMQYSILSPGNEVVGRRFKSHGQFILHEMYIVTSHDPRDDPSLEQTWQSGICG